MKKLMLLLPFPVLVIAEVVILASTRSSPIVGWLCVACFFACLLTVPHHSKKSLARGYLALIFPFALTAAVLTFVPRSLVSVAEVEIKRSDPVPEEPIQASETTRGK